MRRAYRLVYLESPHTPPKLWEWQQPYIHHLIVNARSFHTTRVEQRYFQDWHALASENARLWQAHYRPYPLYDHLASWEAYLDEFRQLILDVQDIHEAHPGWRSPASTRSSWKERAPHMPQSPSSTCVEFDRRVEC